MRNKFTINKQMMLCASVGGNIEDYINMFLITSDLKIIQCPHVEEGKLSTWYVELQEFAFSKEKIGRVGRCKKCGKIYWQELNEYVNREQKEI